MDVRWPVHTHEVLTMVTPEEVEQDWRQEKRTVHPIKEVLLSFFLKTTKMKGREDQERWL